MIWEFPKIRNTLLGVPTIIRDYSILGSILGPPILGNYDILSYVVAMRLSRPMSAGTQSPGEDPGLCQSGYGTDHWIMEKKMDTTIMGYI